MDFGDNDSVGYWLCPFMAVHKGSDNGIQQPGEREAMKLEEGKEIAREFISHIKDLCERVEIAGSIRRQCREVNDIDLVVIPKGPFMAKLITEHMKGKLWQLKLTGKKIVRLIFKKKQIDIYIADHNTWATLLLIRTGSKENNIKLAKEAILEGYQLKADGSGLFDGNGNRIAGNSEESIYEELGLVYQPPEER